jgi:PAS domain S-box-containing protein
MLKSWSIRSQLLALALAVGVPLALLGALNLYFAAEADARLARARVLHLAEITASDTARFLGQAHNVLNGLAARPEVRALDPARCDPLLKDVLGLSPRFANAVTMKLDGEVICSATPFQRPLYMDRDRLLNLLRGPGELTVGTLTPGTVTGKWAIPVGLPLLDGQGRVVGAIGLAIDLVAFPVLPGVDGLPELSITALISADGTVLARSREAARFVGSKVSAERPGLQKKSGSAEVVGIDGIYRIQGFAPVPGTDWIAIASMPADAVYAGTRGRVWQSVLIAAAILLAATMLALQVSRAIRGPIAALAGAAARIAAGDTGARAPVSGPAEIVGVAQQFNRMLDAQRAAVRALEESERHLRLATGAAELGTWEWDVERDRVRWDPLLLNLFGLQAQELADSSQAWIERVHPDDRGRILTAIRKALAEQATYAEEFRIVRPDGEVRWIAAEGRAYGDTPQRALHMVGVARDITARKLAEALIEGQKRVLELIASGAPLEPTLRALVELIEEQAPGMIGSILLLDDDGLRLRHGAGPGLPAAYTKAIDGEPIGERAGSCGTAAFRRAAVVVEDIATDPLWTDYREFALGHGLRACWSTPIFDSRSRLVGTFAMYFRAPRRPSPRDLALIGSATSTAGIAIEREREERELRRANERLHALSARLLDVQENERATIARELHDQLGQSLTALKLSAGALARALPAAEAKRMAEHVAITDRALAQVRTLALELRPPQLDQLGLAAALRDAVERFGEDTGLETAFIDGTRGAEPDRALATAVFRVAQEALTNVARHAEAKRAVVELRADEDSLRLVVFDDGRGFDHAAARARAVAGASMGLLGMEERVALAGGRLEIVSHAGTGTRVEARFRSAARAEKAAAG